MDFWVHEEFSGFTMDFWIDDGFPDSRWISGFTMEFWMHDGFSDARWVSGFAMDFWIRDGFMDSRWISGSAMDFWIRDRFLESQLDYWIPNGFLDLRYYSQWVLKVSTKYMPVLYQEYNVQFFGLPLTSQPRLNLLSTPPLCPSRAGEVWSAEEVEPWLTSQWQTEK